VTRVALPELGLNHLLGLAAAALVALAVWPWLISPAPARSVAAAPDTAAAQSVPSLPPLARFAAISERPLFSPTRKPTPGEKAAPAGPGIDQRYRLLGLMDTGDSRRALLAEGKRRFVIAERATLEGWTVARIEHDRIVLSSPAGEAVLILQPAATNEAWVDPPALTKPPVPEKPPGTAPQR
jgi:hypothetical protein